MKRVLAIVRAVLVSIDQLAATILFGLAALVRLHPVPNPDETISSVVGRRSLEGRRWAKVAERLIDRLFWLLGDGPNHCQRSIEWSELPPR